MAATGMLLLPHRQDLRLSMCVPRPTKRTTEEKQKRRRVQGRNEVVPREAKRARHLPDFVGDIGKAPPSQVSSWPFSLLRSVFHLNQQRPRSDGEAIDRNGESTPSLKHLRTFFNDGAPPPPPIFCTLREMRQRLAKIRLLGDEAGQGNSKSHSAPDTYRK